jgi:hypothetical protein
LYRPGVERLAATVTEIDTGRAVSGKLQPAGTGGYFPAPDAAAVRKFVGNNLKLVSGTEKRLIFRDKARP